MRCQATSVLTTVANVVHIQQSYLGFPDKPHYLVTDIDTNRLGGKQAAVLVGQLHSFIPKPVLLLQMDYIIRSTKATTGQTPERIIGA